MDESGLAGETRGSPESGAVVPLRVLVVARQPILRAGLGMLDGMVRLLPTAEVGFLVMVRDEGTLKPTTYATRLDTFAVNLATAVNTRHADGRTDAGAPGGDFFGPPPADPLSAANIRMLVTDPSELAMAAGSAPAGAKDGGNADWMADLAKLATGPDREYRQLVVDLGAQSQAAKRRAEIQAATVIEVDAQRLSQSGVNLDEEMSNLVQFERSYQAAAKVIATIDEMLDVLINRM